MFVLILLIILIIFYIFINKSTLDNFKSINYPYNPQILTPQLNYQKIMSQINSQQQYKKDLSVALSPIPTINCPKLYNKEDCNKYGCNWFGKYCSSTYPIQY
jgi:hypothetical protein